MKTVGFKDDPNLEILYPIIRSLDDLCNSMVFVGGCATGLLLTSERSELIRPTRDVDVIVQVTTLGDYHAIEKQVAEKGFKHDISDDAPICRWLKDDIMLDLMPSEPGILSFHNRWYPLAVETAEKVRLPNKSIINLISAPTFIATKLEAFLGRGKNDFLASHDLEDLITVIDGREELLDEIKAGNSDLKISIANEIDSLLNTNEFVSSLPGQLPGDSASQSRLPELLQKLKQIVVLGK